MINVKTIRNISYLYLVLAGVGLIIGYSGVVGSGKAIIIAVIFILVGSLAATFHAVLSKLILKVDDLEHQITIIRSNA